MRLYLYDTLLYALASKKSLEELDSENSSFRLSVSLSLSLAPVSTLGFIHTKDERTVAWKQQHYFSHFSTALTPNSLFLVI